MDLISAIRSQQPIQQPSPHPATDRPVSAPAAQGTRPVVETLRRGAVQALSESAAQASVRLAERDEDRHPAAEAKAAAVAAREAYIKASIAAGVSPLPLP